MFVFVYRVLFTTRHCRVAGCGCWTGSCKVQNVASCRRLFTGVYGNININVWQHRVHLQQRPWSKICEIMTRISHVLPYFLLGWHSKLPFLHSPHSCFIKVIADPFVKDSALLLVEVSVPQQQKLVSCCYLPRNKFQVWPPRNSIESCGDKVTFGGVYAVSRCPLFGRGATENKRLGSWLRQSRKEFFLLPGRERFGGIWMSHWGV